MGTKLAKFRHLPNGIRVGSFGASVFIVFACLCAPDFAQNSKPSAGTASTKSASAGTLVARGKYIVEGVAVCTQCHTPRTSTGEYDRTKWLEGAPVRWKPADPSSDWPLQAPRIAGTPPGSDAEMITLLTTGRWQNGKPLRQPMPQFRMSAQDAQSVVAYLRSLSPPAR